MFEEAVNLCSAADTNAALGYWDKGVAYYTGSLEGGDGNSKIGTYGELGLLRKQLPKALGYVFSARVG